MTAAAVADTALVARVLDELAAAVAVFSGPDLRVEAANQAVHALTGPGRELVGRPFAEAFPELHDQHIGELIEHVRTTGEPVEAQERLLLFDRRGSGPLDEVFLTFSMHPITIDGERWVLAHGVDVTAAVVARREAPAAADRSAERYRSAREVVWSLQRSLLPDRLPLLPQMRMAAHYVLAGDENAAGGDWFEAVALDDGRVAVMVGDVVGHGPAATGLMGQLRAVMAQLLVDGRGIAEVLDRLDRFAARLRGAAGSTVCLAVVDPAAATLEYASCGHPPPLVVSAVGRARYLDLPGGGPLAVVAPAPRVARVVLDPDDVVLLYTDGLVGRCDRPLQERFDRLCEVTGATTRTTGDPVNRLCAAALEGMEGGGFDDDVAVLALWLTAPVEPLRLELPAGPGSERVVRRRMHEWMTAVGVDQADALDLQLALGEAVSNVTAHAYPDSTGPMVVEVEHDRAGRVSVTVADRGHWQDPEVSGRHSGSGRGLRMMRATTDLVEIDRGPDGTVVSMDRTVGVPTVLRMAPDTATVADLLADPVPALRIVRNSRSERTHLALDGWLDAASVPELRTEAMRSSRGGAQPLTIDLEAVTGIASAGVALLFELAELAPGGQPLELRASGRSAAVRILDIVDLRHLLAPPATPG
jgi:serine phosphatase RsbU (regulator of sigma subunit)/anti-sigma regulatory factor (Ser/Thr protein kinase)/ABC-type transporter Mla MlaB component